MYLAEPLLPSCQQILNLCRECWKKSSSYSFIHQHGTKPCRTQFRSLEQASGELKGRNLPALRPAPSIFRAHLRCPHPRPACPTGRCWAVCPDRQLPVAVLAGRCRHAQASGKCRLRGLPGSRRPQQTPPSIDGPSSRRPSIITCNPAAGQAAGCREHAGIALILHRGVAGCLYSMWNAHRQSLQHLCMRAACRPLPGPSSRPQPGPGGAGQGVARAAAHACHAQPLKQASLFLRRAAAASHHAQHPSTHNCCKQKDKHKLQACMPAPGCPFITFSSSLPVCARGCLQTLFNAMCTVCLPHASLILTPLAWKSPVL